MVRLTEDIGVSQQSRLIELGLAEPARLLGREEDLDGDILVVPLGLPHLAVAPLADAPLQRDLLGDRALHLNASTARSYKLYNSSNETEWHMEQVNADENACIS